jgi:hypothetical protein
MTTLVAIVAIAAAAGVAVIAAAFALYALLRDWLGPAGAAAVVAGTAALIVALAGLIVLLGSRPKPARRQDDGLMLRAFDLAKEKPLIAAAAALAAVVLFRNPKIATAALTAFLAGKAAPKN